MKHTGARLVRTHKKSSRVSSIWHSMQQHMCTRLIKIRCIAFLVCSALLLPGTLLVLPAQSVVYAANQVSEACVSYTVVQGDTLNTISRRYHTTAMYLASVNHISNINRIIAGQHLCITNKPGSRPPSNHPRCQPIPRQLEWSSTSQVASSLRQAAAIYGLPAKLLLAIAWEESGWQQHVIACDGGIGTMQLMPQTVKVLNAQTHAHYDPYKLADNITLGAIYLRSLWLGFHGNLTKVISAYNEGAANVIHLGIFNWHYVNNVLALMRKF